MRQSTTAASSRTLLDQAVDDNGDKRPVYADSAYRSKEHRETLADAQIESQVCEKGTCGCPLSEEQKQSNQRKSNVIGLMNVVYNIRRLVQLLARDAKALARTLSASRVSCAHSNDDPYAFNNSNACMRFPLRSCAQGEGSRSGVRADDRACRNPA